MSLAWGVLRGVRCLIPIGALGLLAVFLLQPSAADPATIEMKEPRAVAPPVLLLIHGGGFFRGDPSAMDYAARIAAAQGRFVTIQPRYPLDDLAGAFTRLRDLALALRARGRRVFAYGDSAGGAIAAWLASRGFVRAAAAKAPPTDLVDWNSPFALHYSTAPLGDPHSWRHLRADRRARIAYSVANRPSLRPLRIFQSCADLIVPCKDNIRFARRDPNVSLTRIWGAHDDPAAKLSTITRALSWLSAQSEA